MYGRFSFLPSAASAVPGGYCWRPSAGDEVLVLKAGGTVDLRGSVTIDGVPLEELFAPKEEGGEIVDGGETGTGTGTGTGSGSGGGGGA